MLSTLSSCACWSLAMVLMLMMLMLPLMMLLPALVQQKRMLVSCPPENSPQCHTRGWVGEEGREQMRSW